MNTLNTKYVLVGGLVFAAAFIIAVATILRPTETLEEITAEKVMLEGCGGTDSMIKQMKELGYVRNSTGLFSHDPTPTMITTWIKGVDEITLVDKLIPESQIYYACVSRPKRVKA